MTSCPMRGMWMAPKFLPAQGCDTRTQQLLLSLRLFFLASRSQWNCTFTRPYLSVKISSPDGPTTTADCGPCMKGLGVRRGGRYCCLEGMAEKSQRNSPPLPPESDGFTCAWIDAVVIRYSAF